MDGAGMRSKEDGWGAGGGRGFAVTRGEDDYVQD